MEKAMMRTAILCLTFAASVSVNAQQHDHAAMIRAGEGTTNLSAEQIAQLLAGEGMGLAKAAELNHFPGPKHVLEHAKDLALTPEQQRRVEAVRADMLTAVKKLGAELIEAERALDRSFEHRHIDPSRLQMLTSTIGRLQGELRAAHLRAHLTTRELLSPEQITQYDKVRGYTK
jgi:hypothetical protein